MDLQSLDSVLNTLKPVPVIMNKIDDSLDKFIKDNLIVGTEYQKLKQEFYESPDPESRTFSIVLELTALTGDSKFGKAFGDYIHNYKKILYDHATYEEIHTFETLFGLFSRRLIKRHIMRDYYYDYSI